MATKSKRTAVLNLVLHKSNGKQSDFSKANSTVQQAAETYIRVGSTANFVIVMRFVVVHPDFSEPHEVLAWISIVISKLIHAAFAKNVANVGTGNHL